MPPSWLRLEAAVRNEVAGTYCRVRCDLLLVKRIVSGGLCSRNSKLFSYIPLKGMTNRLYKLDWCEACIVAFGIGS